MSGKNRWNNPPLCQVWLSSEAMNIESGEKEETVANTIIPMIPIPATQATWDQHAQIKEQSVINSRWLKDIPPSKCRKLVWSARKKIRAHHQISVRWDLRYEWNQPVRKYKRKRGLRKKLKMQGEPELWESSFRKTLGCWGIGGTQTH